MQVVDDSKVQSRFSIGGHPQAIDLICPHCLKEATFTAKVWSEHAGQAAVTEIPCPRCNIGVLFLQLIDHRDSHGESTLYVHPDPIGRGGMPGVEHLRSLSAPLARSYDSALKLYNHGEWGSAALTVRHLLEGLASRLLGDEREQPLTRQIEALPKDVDLTKPLQDIAPLLAPGGTFGRQFDDETGIDQVIAEQLLDLAEQLISYLVVLPGTMAELKSRIATAPVPLRRGASNSAA